MPNSRREDTTCDATGALCCFPHFWRGLPWDGWERLLNSARSGTGTTVVQKVVEALYYPKCGIFVHERPKGTSHVGSQLFAYRAARGLVICSYAALDSIAAWADQTIAEASQDQTVPNPPLKGF